MDDVWSNQLSFAPAPPSPTLEAFKGYIKDDLSAEPHLKVSTLPKLFPVSPTKRNRKSKSNTHSSRRQPGKKKLKPNQPTQPDQLWNKDVIPLDTTNLLPMDELPSFTEALPIENSDDHKNYTEHALLGIAGFYQISSEVFVAQGWDSRAASTTVSVSTRRNGVA